MLGKRPPDCNKGDNGKGLLLAGSEGFYGAAVMAATACLRAGIGTLKVVCPGPVKQAFAVLPEAMVYGIGPDWSALDPAWARARLEEATCIGLGPGMGRSPGVGAALRLALATQKAMVVDADGLNALSGFSEGERRALLHKGAVLTPHPGEMARLTGLSVKEIKEDPAAVAQSYAKAWGCTVLLKGHRTAIAGPDGEFAWNQSGNAGLAKGGSGDVLTGMILALLGQKLRPFAAACVGSYLLGASAETAFGLLQERMLMARDVIGAMEGTLAFLWKPALHDGVNQNEEN